MSMQNNQMSYELDERSHVFNWRKPLNDRSALAADAGQTSKTLMNFKTSPNEPVSITLNQVIFYRF